MEGAAAAAIPVQGDAQLVLDERAEIDPAADRVEVDGVAVGVGRGAGPTHQKSPCFLPIS